MMMMMMNRYLLLSLYLMLEMVDNGMMEIYLNQNQMMVVMDIRYLD
jgi:hypothetical protein